MKLYPLTITNISGTTTPCNSYNVYVNDTITIPSTPFAANVAASTLASGYHFIYPYSGTSTTLYVFLEHCDGHVQSIPGDTPKEQGAYQINAVHITCPI
jgi:hypothetical protein